MSSLGLPTGEALALLIEHFGGGALGKTGVLEFRLNLGDLFSVFPNSLAKRFRSASKSINPSSGKYKSPKAEPTRGVPLGTFEPSDTDSALSSTFSTSTSWASDLPPGLNV